MPESNQCSVCLRLCYPPAPRCNFCDELVCRECRVSDSHTHTDDERFVVGFCFPCARLQGLVYDAEGVPHCVVCETEWSPRVAVGVTDPGEMICPFCSARQKKPLLPARCARCAMTLM